VDVETCLTCAHNRGFKSNNGEMQIKCSGQAPFMGTRDSLDWLQMGLYPRLVQERRRI